MSKRNRFSCPVLPCAAPANIVSGANYRFTVLTDSLLRMEYSENGCFEDRASQCAFFRDFPETVFSYHKEKGVVTVQTEKLVLTYQENAPFTKDSVQVQLKCEPKTLWHFGDVLDNLGGATKTLDTVDGACPVEDGVCSRSGVAERKSAGLLHCWLPAGTKPCWRRPLHRLPL